MNVQTNISLDGFKDIPEYESYCIDNKGNVYSKKNKKILSYYLSKKSNSRIVDLCKNGKYKSIHVDVLVNKLFPKEFKELIGSRPHPIYKDLYIKENGTIYSVKKYNGSIYYVNEMSPSISGGYNIICYNKNNIKKNLFIHRLVAETFIPNPNNYPQVNHKDENKLNNCVDNLEWCDSIYNNRYGTRIQRQCKTQGFSIRLIDTFNNTTKKFISINECARYLNTSSNAIRYSIKNNISYKNKYNFIFEK